MTPTKMGVAVHGYLARQRKSLGLKQRQIAASIGIDQYQFSRMLNGHIPMPDEVLFAYAAAVGCTIRVTRNDIDMGGAQ